MCASNKALDRFSECVDNFVRANWPGVSAECVTIHFSDGRKPFRLPRPGHIASSSRRRSCSPDGSSVDWDGVKYTFRGIQARIVRLLWDAWEQNTPDLRQEWLLEEAGAESTRLLDLFKKSPAWGVVIVPGDKAGTFRISDQ